ncbi:hypothetical protein B0H17DRAFT_530812 [Mycena rosella]|uniref:Uncharacterized protein n=1 Tax=Mycena rosella TaxID=1033263 RepID=A0AAD7MA58_MYCRO|nr:hypothetical protein B0H17DRAFT_530812 [Mycena rosella]
MSDAAATEGDIGNPSQTAPETAVVAQFTPDSLDITTGGLGMKQPTNDEAEHSNTSQADLKDASPEPGATEHNVEGIESFASTNGADLSSVQEIVFDKTTGSKSGETPSEHDLVDVPAVQPEDHHPLSDVEKDVSREEEVPEVDSGAPSTLQVPLHDEGASNVPTDVPAEVEASPVLDDSSIPSALPEASSVDSELSSVHDETNLSVDPAEELDVSPSAVTEAEVHTLVIPEEDIYPTAVPDAETTVVQDVTPDTDDVSPSAVIEAEVHTSVIPEEDIQPTAVPEAGTTLVQDVTPDTEVHVDDQYTPDAGVEQGALHDPVFAQPEDSSAVATETTLVDPVIFADDSREETTLAETPELSKPSVISEILVEDEKFPTEVAQESDQGQVEHLEQSITASFSQPSDADSLVDGSTSFIDSALVIESTTPFEADPSAGVSHEERAEHLVLVDGEEPEIEIATEQPSDETDTSRLVAAREPEIERPRSPWTPSYSVVTQGPGISASDEAEIAELPVLPPSVNALEFASGPEEHSDPPPVLIHAEPTVTVTGTPDDDEPEVPQSSDSSRPWTPSYSVVVQGSPRGSPRSVQLNY